MTDRLLRKSLVALDVNASGLGDVIGAAAHLLAGEARMSEAVIARALGKALNTPGFAIDGGVAVPHVDLDEVPERLVAFVRTRAGIDIGAADGVPADLFFVLLARRDDPREHLLALARLARLAHSRVLVRGLRGAGSADEVVELAQVAEARGALTAVAPATTESAERLPSDGADGGDQLILITVAGERTVDRLLVSLVEAGLDGASIVDGDTLRDAATKEVPLFSGFADLFGDPGGHRVILARTAHHRAREILQMVRQLCEAVPPKAAAVYLLPVHTVWTFAAAAEAAASAP